jgi:cyanoexosortase B
MDANTNASPPLSRRPFSITPELALIGLLSIFYAPLLWHWSEGWLNKSISIQHEYFSHGLLGLPLAAYLTWEKRQAWQQLSDQINPLGILITGLALWLYRSGLSDWMNLSLPLILIGLCLLLKGIPGCKLLAFPLALVALATPTQLPYLIEPYILPLQSFIAQIAGFILLQIGTDVAVDGIYITINEQLVEVAPHCAGLKMLFTSLYMGMVLTYWSGLYTARIRTGIFFVGILLVSVVGNIARNTILSFFHGHQMDAAFHWLHESWGGDVYSALMLGSLVLLVRMIQSWRPHNLPTASDTSDDGPSPNATDIDDQPTLPPQRRPYDF